MRAGYFVKWSLNKPQRDKIMRYKPTKCSCMDTVNALTFLYDCFVWRSCHFGFISWHPEQSRQTVTVTNSVTQHYINLMFSMQHSRLMICGSPPDNRLEALRGDFAGFHSIRINSQWRIVFRWQSSNVHDVRVIDYH